MQVSGQLACQAVPGCADLCRTVRPHLGPMILILADPQLPGKLPAKLPVNIAATGSGAGLVVDRPASAAIQPIQGPDRSGHLVLIFDARWGRHTGSSDGGRSPSGGRKRGGDAALEGSALRFSERAWSDQLLGGSNG